MLRAAHYKPDAVDGPSAGKSPPRHRTGGILDLALTAADKYALSLLPTALKGTGLASNDGPATDYRAAPQQHPSNGVPPAFKMQRGAGNPLLHNLAPTSQEAQPQHPGHDSRVATSWDASLKEILAALEPESRTLKPAKLRDHKYPNQNHGLPTHTVTPAPRRELDEALVTLPGGTRRGKSSVPIYAAGFKGFSRQSRRPEFQGNSHLGALQTMDVQYDVVPSVKLAWAGPGNGTYSTTGFGGSPKKYTSQLVGRVSPHYAGTPGLQQSMSTPAGNQDPLHLPEIANANGQAAAHQAGGFRGSNSAIPSYQSWTPPPTGAAGHTTQTRRALPYVSGTTPSLAKPLTVQYHPVLKSPSLGASPGSLYGQPSGGSPASGWGPRGTPQRPATDHGPSPLQGGGAGPGGDSAKFYPRSPYGSQPHRMPQTPPEVAAEVARLRHAQELDGVINGVRSDLMQAAAPRPDAPVKSKFLQMYEDPNRPLAKLNPKQLLGDVGPASQQRRHRPPGITADKPQLSTDGGLPSPSPSSSGTASRSPMYERRLRPLPSDAQSKDGASGGSAAPTSDGADALVNVHLQPPELPDGTALEDAAQPELHDTGAEAPSTGRSTPVSSQLEREDTELTEVDFAAAADDDGAAGSREAAQPGAAAEAAELQEYSGREAAVEAEAAPSGGAPALEAASPRPVGDEAGLETEPGASPRVLEGTNPAEASGQELEREAVQAGDEASTEQAAALQEYVQQDDVQMQPPASDAGDAASAGPQGAADVSATGLPAEPWAVLQQPVEDSQQEQPRASAPGEAAAAVEPCQDLGASVQAGLSAAVAGGAESLQQDAGALAGAAESTRDTDDGGASERAAAAEPACATEQDALRGVSGSGDSPVDPASAPGPEPEAIMAEGSPSGSQDADAQQGGSDQNGAADRASAESDGGRSVEDNATADSVNAPSEAPLAGDAAAATRLDVAVEGVTEELVLSAILDAPDAAAKAAAPAEGPDGLACAADDGYPAEPSGPEGAAAEREPEVPSVAAAEAEAADPVDRIGYTLPPGVTPEMARASAVCIQSHARGFHARRRLAAMRNDRDAGAASLPPPLPPGSPALEQLPYELPPGITPEMARASAVCIQSHARGLHARRRLAAMRNDRDAGAAPLPPPLPPGSPALEQIPYELPPGVTPEMARASAVCIQSHARGYHARRRLAAMRKSRNAGRTAPLSPLPPDSPARSQLAYELPSGVTPEMARAAIVRIQSHARGYFARRQVAELRKGHEAGEAALTTAVTAVAARKLEAYELPVGVTAELAEAAATRVQAHMRGHLARRRVKHLRSGRVLSEAQAEAAPRAAGEGHTGQGPADEDTTLREAGEAVSTGAEGEAVQLPPPGPVEPEEMTIDDLKAALADEGEEEEEDPEQRKDAAEAEVPISAVEEPALLDMSDPAVVAAAAAAAAAAKGAIRLLDDDTGAYGPDGVADTTAATDQAAEEASMAGLAATSARMSAMFQGAGAEMRYSDDEASALELMDNLDGLLQGDDEAAAAAAAVAAATAPADGEIVSISADGVSEPQSLGGAAASTAANPMDVTEPGGVRVLASKYEVQHVVGEGAYGMVMKCKVRGTEPVQWVAIKEFKIDDNDPDAEDVKRTSLREVSVLEALQHPHVVGFVDKFMVGDRLFIVMEFLPCNLLELLEAQPGGMDRDAVRLIMFQLCSAIAFIHSKGMVYRDIKPENLLVDEHGTVKLCDFGFARYVPSGPNSHLTDYVATRWYRAPELLLGPPYRDALGKHTQYMYGAPVDMWAVGCLMGELLDGEPLFAGDSDLDQLYRVQQILGPMAPSHQYMFYANPHNTGIVFNIKQPVTLGSRYRGKVSDVELSFMMGLLEMDPDKRISGEQCLQHPYLADLTSASQALPTPSPTASNTPTATNLSLDDGGSAGGQDGDQAAGRVSGVVEASSSSSAPAEAPKPVSPFPGPRLSESREALESRGIEKAGSLTRAAGSLTRGGRSLSRGTISPGLVPPPVSSSPVPGSGPQRGGSKLLASENGQVVIVEGLEDEDEEGEEGQRAAVPRMASVKSVSALAELAAVISEIEPVEEQ